ncbi:MAG TPA: MarR family transcriptional regulator [Actinotalea caeni]|uniref:MarR family winged helix-turn-helix transcriptional regulator n=1 Tax=Actinotalea caeni TaxID=1348467 RepID=UPI002B4B1FB3|nr:MarR family transcriptional regulator [Actinotalea caeni]HLV57204.1 MarR family transcriptional regulator [Actinotalea caeni]
MSTSDTWARVATFATAVDGALDRWLAEHHRVGLSEYRALGLLVAAPAKELRIAELAHAVGLTSTSTTRLVSRLESKGLARRDLCEDDGRGVYAVVTDAGETLVREVRAPYEERLRAILTDPATVVPHLDVDTLGASLQEVAALVAPPR